MRSHFASIKFCRVLCFMNIFEFGTHCFMLNLTMLMLTNCFLLICCVESHVAFKVIAPWDSAQCINLIQLTFWILCCIILTLMNYFLLLKNKINLRHIDFFYYRATTIPGDFFLVESVRKKHLMENCLDFFVWGILCQNHFHLTPPFEEYGGQLLNFKWEHLFFYGKILNFWINNFLRFATGDSVFEFEFSF